MAAVLIRLRWAVRRSAVSSPVLLALVWWGAAVAGVLAAAASAALVSSADDGARSLTGLLLQSLLLTIFVGWILMPLSVPQLQDQLVDPARLELYPLSARQKVVGLGAGAMLSPTALFAFLAACGPAFAPGMPVLGRLVTPVLAVVFSAMCVAVSRMIQSFFAGAMQGRRGRDLSVLLAGTLGIGFYAALQLLPRAIPADGSAPTVSPVIGEVILWLPSGAVGQATLAFREGAFASALLSMTVAVAWLVALTAAWGWSLARAEKGGHHGVDRSARPSRAGLVLPPVLIRGLRSPQMLAAASQHVRYMRRHPKMLQAVAMGVVFGAFVSHMFVGGDWLGAGAAFFPAYLAIMVGGAMFNFDGQGVAYLHVTGAELGPVLRAKQGIVLCGAITLGSVFAVAEAAWSDQWRNLAAALLLVIGMALWAVAGVIVMATRYAYDGERSSSARYDAIGPSIALIAWILAGVGVVALLYGVAGIWVPRGAAALVLVVVAGALHRVSLHRHEALLERRPELVTDRVPSPA